MRRYRLWLVVGVVVFVVVEVLVLVLVLMVVVGGVGDGRDVVGV